MSSHTTTTPTVSSVHSPDPDILAVNTRPATAAGRMFRWDRDRATVRHTRRVCEALQQVTDLQHLTGLQVRVGGVQDKVLDGCRLTRDRHGWISAAGVMVLTPDGRLMPRVKHLRFTTPA